MYVNLQGKRIAFYTLGCKVNQYETDSMMDLLKKEGCHMVPFKETADIYIINTCSVTNMADRKSRQIIHRAKKQSKEGIVVAVGCYVQAVGEELLTDKDIDIIVGNNRKKEIARILSEYLYEKSATDNLIDINRDSQYEEMTLIKPSEHTRAYVKVQDGCNNFCSYCIIPYTRGRIRSRELRDVVREISGLAKEGIKEVVITGINLSSYMDKEENDLLKLLVAVSDIKGIDRIRMGSLEPRIITEEFLQTISAIKKICPHFHLSLQSACNETLKRMNRKYTIEEYMEKCNMLRRYYDRPAITTDIIVGFPGETLEEFATTKKNLEELNLYEMHIFKYSRRSGTVAATMPNQVPDQEKEDRSKILLALAADNKKRYEDSFANETVDILVEEYIEEEGVYYCLGHSDRYIMLKKAMTLPECELAVNKIITIKPS